MEFEPDRITVSIVVEVQGVNQWDHFGSADRKVQWIQNVTQHLATLDASLLEMINL